MKESFDIPTKKVIRTKYKQFLSENMSHAPKNILCLSGCEALEIFEVYDQLGYDRKSIVSCEIDDDAYKLLDAQGLGIEIHHEDIEEYLEETDKKFDIINLDFCGTFHPRLADCISTVFHRQLLKPDGIFACTFMARREKEDARDMLKLSVVGKMIGTALSDYIHGTIDNKGLSSRIKESNNLMNNKRIICREGIDLHILIVSSIGPAPTKSLDEIMSKNSEELSDELISQERLDKNRRTYSIEKSLPIKSQILLFLEKRQQYINSDIHLQNGLFPVKIKRYIYHSDKGTPMKTSMYKFAPITDWLSKINFNLYFNRIADMNSDELITEKVAEGMVHHFGWNDAFFYMISYFCPELWDYISISEDVLEGNILPSVIKIKDIEVKEEEMPKKIPHKMDDATKKRILKALRANVDKDKIARIFGVTKMQVSALDAWRTMGKY
jgi:hypothetical protein